jgi:hypothetical protein
MILLAVLALALAVSFILGGRLEGLGRIHVRHSYLILLALAIQILVFSAAWQASLSGSAWSSLLYGLSLALLLAAVWVNRRVPGLALLGVGLCCNALVILSNGGHMPASLAALRQAGILAADAAFDTLQANNSGLIGPGTALWFLGDVFAVPAAVPLANVFSVGDVLIALGGAWFIWAATRPERAIPSPARSLPQR